MTEDFPIYKAIFGSDWDLLPPVFKKHYANRPHTNDVCIADGVLSVVMCAGPFKFLGPLLNFFGQVPAFNEENVPCVVRFESAPNSKALAFNRTFTFKNRKYVFHSRMKKISNDCVGEIMRFGFVWKMHYFWNGEKIILHHRGYGFNFFGHVIPLPVTFLFGEGYAEEQAIDDNNFNMMTHITHPWWGKIYEYKGQFRMTDTVV